MCTDPSMGQRLMALPHSASGWERTRNSDGKALTDKQSFADVRIQRAKLFGLEPSKSDRAIVLGGSESQSVGGATQTSRRRAAVAAQPVIPGKTPVMK